MSSVHVHIPPQQPSWVAALCIWSTGIYRSLGAGERDLAESQLNLAGKLECSALNPPFFPICLACERPYCIWHISVMMTFLIALIESACMA